MATLHPSIIKYNIYIISRIPGQHASEDQLTAYTLLDTRFNFDTEKSAEEWIDKLGEKKYEYTILKTYQLP